MSAIVFCVVLATSRRARPTFTVNHRKNGMRHSDRSVSGTDSASIAINVEMITTTLDRIEDAVSVTTVCTPPTSFERRDWISPVRVEVKNRNGMCWRCRYNESRRSCITRKPTKFA